MFMLALTLGEQLLLPGPIRYGQPRSRIGLNAVLRNWITQAVRCEPFHSFDGLGQKVRRNCHQQLFIQHSAVAPLRITWDRKTGLSGFERAPPRVRASRFSDHAPLKFAIARPL